MPLHALPLPDAELALDPAWMPAVEADALLAELMAAVPWEVHRLRLFGRLVDSPRLSCWIGDPDASYAYSGTRFAPHPWPAGLSALRGRVEAACAAPFNSVLANLYRDGRDAMGWHRDDERELGAEPVIASLSLGATRRFLLKRAPRPGRGGVGEREWDRQGMPLQGPPSRPLALPLGHGSLLRMAGGTQRYYRHALPRTARPVGPRLNLTFRQVAPGG